VWPRPVIAVLFGGYDFDIEAPLKYVSRMLPHNNVGTRLNVLAALKAIRGIGVQGIAKEFKVMYQTVDRCSRKDGGRK
jgi:hypothetical protein